MDLNPQHDLHAILTTLAAEKAPVELHLRNGRSIAGLLGGVGPHTVHVQQIVGKEFFDAAIRVDAVDSIEVRMRTR